MTDVRQGCAAIGLALLWGACANPSLVAADLEIAVAANFTATLRELTERFENQTGYVVTLASGSTGKHFAQITNGAPFDAFFAADRTRPERLESAGLTVPGTRFTYALGQLVLYSRLEDFVDAGGAVLAVGGFRHLAIANPRLAPYGIAARQVLEARGLWDRLQDRLVRGENVAQAFQFVASGNAELGFVALSHVVLASGGSSGSWWLVPAELYTPIEQQAVMLVDSEPARAFWAWFQSEDTRLLLREQGYGTP